LTGALRSSSGVASRQWGVCRTNRKFGCSRLWRVLTTVAYSPHFDRDLRIVLLANADFSDYVVLCSTDLEQPAEQVAEYYRLRYQLEFVIRDAKQHAGLTHCQARSQEKIDFHLNMSACGGRIAPPASPKTGLFAVYLPPGVVQSDAHHGCSSVASSPNPASAPSLTDRTHAYGKLSIRAAWPSEGHRLLLQPARTIDFYS
jgi:hypothetical protein